MKRIVSFLLLALMLSACVLSFSACGFQYYEIGVVKESVGDEFMRGNTKKGFSGYSIDTESFADATAAEASLLRQEVDYILLLDEEAEQLTADNADLKKIEFAVTEKGQSQKTEFAIVALKTDTAFDAYKGSEEILNALDDMQKSDFQIEWELFYSKFVTYKGYEVALQGLATTMEIAIIGLMIGILIGTFIAMIKMIPKYHVTPRILSAICDVYVGFFRGTPMVVQLLIGWFILLPALGWQIDNTVVAALVFGMNSGAYVSEIMRSGIQAVDIGQLEAARALGLGYWTSMLKIVIPQGIKNILPTLGNEFIILVKDTSIVSFIAVVDITKAFRQIGDANYSYIIPYLMLALIYLVIVLLITWLIKLMERRLAKSERRK